MAEDLALKIPLQGDVSPISQALDQMKGKVSASMENVKAAMGMIGIAAAGYLVKAVESAAKASEATDALKTKLENTGVSAGSATSGINTFTAGVEKMSTYGAGDAKAALDTLITRHVSLGEAMKDQTGITELAAAKSISLKDAADQVANAENGRMGGLVKLGVVTKAEVKNHISMATVMDRLNKSYKGLAEGKMATLPGQIEVMHRDFAEFTTGIGMVLLPVITSLAKKFTALVTFITNASKPMKKLIAGVLVTVAVLGTLIGGIAAVTKVGSILSPVFTGIKGAMAAAEVSAGALVLPIIAIIAAIVLFVAAYKTNFGGFKTFVDGIIKDVIGIFNNLVDWFKTNWPMIKAKFEEVMVGIQAAYNTYLKPVLDFMLAQLLVVVNWVKANWPLIKTVIKDAMRDIQIVIEVVLGIVKVLWDVFGGAIMTIVKTVFNIVGTVISTAMHVILGIITMVMDLVTGHWGAAWNALVGVVKNILGGLGSIIGNILNGIGSIFGDMANTAIGWGKNIINGFISGIESMAGEVGQAASGIVQSVAGFMGFHSPSKEGEGQHIVEWGENMISGFMGGIKNKLPDMKKLMSSVIQSPSLNANVNLSGAASGIGSPGNNNSSTVNQSGFKLAENVIINNNMDVKKFAEMFEFYRTAYAKGTGGN